MTAKHVGEIIEVVYRDADGDMQLARLTVPDAIALGQELCARLQEYADMPEGGGDAD